MEKMTNYLETLTDEEIKEIGKRMGVDYSHTTWKEERQMIIEDYCQKEN